MSEQNLEEVEIEVEEVESEEVIENEVDEPTDEVEAEADNDNEEGEDEDQEEDGEMVVVLEGDEPEKDEDKEPAPEWVKNVRKENKQLKRELKELKKSKDVKTEEDTPLRARPKLEDFEYDEDQFGDDLDKWVEEKQSFNASQKSKKDEVAAQTKVWETRMSEYDEGKSSFNDDSYTEAETNVSDALDATRVGLIVDAFGSGAAKVVSYLGNNEDKLKELAAIKSLTQFTVAITRLEGKMTTQKRNIKPKPERRIKGGTPAPSGSKTLEQLEKEADRTGDRSKIVAFKRQQKQAT